MEITPELIAAKNIRPSKYGSKLIILSTYGFQEPIEPSPGFIMKII